MPRTKQRSVRRAKRRPPRRHAESAQTQSDTPTGSASTNAESGLTTASERKLSLSPHTASEYPSSVSSSESESESDGPKKGARILEVTGIQSALKNAVCCKECGGPVLFKEELFKREGLCTHPYLFCQSCQTKTAIPFACSGSRSLAVNRRAVLANKCVGGSYTSLETLCVLLDLPPPVSQHAYQQHMKVIAMGARTEVEESMSRARKELRDLYDVPPDQIINILISCDGTWQKRGFSSLFGVVFVIAYETGKVIDYTVLSKHCSGCKKWENENQTQAEYRAWKENHVCSINFTGSAGAMEPFGTLALFQRSVGYNLRYKYLVSDGDSKTFALLSREQVYGTDPEDQVVKLDCVGHVQKRLGTALRNLKVKYRGQKLSDGKTIGGARRLTDSLINSLQNYYGNAIRSNKGSLDLMVRAVQATLLHSNSSDETPRHHLCPPGEHSWCKWQRAQALGIEYSHTKPPIPEAIVLLLKPIYARLGSPLLLQKCLEGYTQNANEALHSTVWKLCPKELFLGKESVDIACSIAVCRFNDGACALLCLSKRIELTTSHFCRHVLRKRDRLRVQKSKYKSSERGKAFRRRARKKRKGIEDRNKDREGPVYVPGGFDCDPGPSKRARTS
jgi:hypothetical protein